MGWGRIEKIDLGHFNLGFEPERLKGLISAGEGGLFFRRSVSESGGNKASIHYTPPSVYYSYNAGGRSKRSSMVAFLSAAKPHQN